jgi:hypothetical protein
MFSVSSCEHTFWKAFMTSSEKCGSSPSSSNVLIGIASSARATLNVPTVCAERGSSQTTWVGGINQSIFCNLWCRKRSWNAEKFCSVVNVSKNRDSRSKGLMMSWSTGSIPPSVPIDTGTPACLRPLMKRRLMPSSGRSQRTVNSLSSKFDRWS